MRISISLNNTVMIGRDSQAHLRLDAPTISRVHATIAPRSQGDYTLHTFSLNGVYVNGKQSDNIGIIHEGDTLQIGFFTLLIKNRQLLVIDGGDRIRLDVHDLILETKGKRRLDNLSFPIEAGQFVALVGGSGAGKSTLLRTLLGVETPTSGAIYINGHDLRRNYNIYRQQIGYVPQDDIIHANLTVEAALGYAARLRLPPDTDFKGVVERTLERVEMTHRRRAAVGNLSGGQRKRVSIGVELLANPKLFFLDEPTSGLDPGLDLRMMEMLRDLAHNEGRTIVLVTHATSNITKCDRIAFLGRDGKFCYFGSPQDALTFFRVDNFADIYVKLEDERSINFYTELYGGSSCRDKYVKAQLSPANSKDPGASTKAKIDVFKQWWIFTDRQFNLVSRDRINIILALLTAPVGISLIKFALQDTNPFVTGADNVAGLALQVLLVFTCASLWVGLSSSLQEIVKEKAIYLRERLINLDIPAYLGSKVAVLILLAIIQTVAIYYTVTTGFKSPVNGLISWQIGLSINTFLTLIASSSLGLLISAAVGNGSQANSALPLILLPQIIFSGVLFKLKGAGAIASYLMITRWSIGGYGTIANVNGLLPVFLHNKALKDLPFPTGAAYEQSWKNLGLNWLLLIIHSIVYLQVTAWLQKRKDIL